MAQIDITPETSPVTLSALRFDAKKITILALTGTGRLAMWPGRALIAAICAMGRAFEMALVDPYPPTQQRRNGSTQRKS